MACNDEQRERYLIPAVKGEKFDALAMTEPDAGSDVRGMKCFAKPRRRRLDRQRHQAFHQPCQYRRFRHRLHRHRRGGNAARPEEEDHLLPRRSRHAGLRNPQRLQFRLASRLQELHPRFRRLPPALGRQVLGEVHKGFDIANDWLYGTRLTVAATCVGRARRVFDYGPALCRRAQAVRQADRRQPGRLLQARRHDHRDRRRRLADARRRLAARPEARRQPRDRLRQALRLAKCWPASPTRRSRSMAAWD